MPDERLIHLPNHEFEDFMRKAEKIDLWRNRLAPLLAIVIGGVVAWTCLGFPGTVSNYAAIIGGFSAVVGLIAMGIVLKAVNRHFDRQLEARLVAVTPPAAGGAETRTA